MSLLVHSDCIPPLEQKLWELRVFIFSLLHLKPWIVPVTWVYDKYLFNEWRNMIYFGFSPPCIWTKDPKGGAISIFLLRHQDPAQCLTQGSIIVDRQLMLADWSTFERALEAPLNTRAQKERNWKPIFLQSATTFPLDSISNKGGVP